jgi:hypothetical protein
MVTIFLSGSTLYAQASIQFERFKNNPIITADLLPSSDGDDINGPSIVIGELHVK